MPVYHTNILFSISNCNIYLEGCLFALRPVGDRAILTSNASVWRRMAYGPAPHRRVFFMPSPETATAPRLLARPQTVVAGDAPKLPCCPLKGW